MSDVWQVVVFVFQRFMPVKMGVGHLASLVLVMGVQVMVVIVPVPVVVEGGGMGMIV